MRLTQIINRATAPLRGLYHLASFYATPRQACDLSRLRTRSDIDLDKIFHDPTIEKGWGEIATSLSRFSAPDGTGGVNPGDGRALFYLARALGATSVLEVGTHIGISTMHLAAALDQNMRDQGKPTQLTSVDIEDVNCVERRPWENYHMPASPSGMMATLGYQGHVQFVTAGFLDYAKDCSTLFDIIFLDGDHRAAAVYSEIPKALSMLKPGGIIMLHDYFPDQRPLWPDGRPLKGPARAVARLRREGVMANALPLGTLPWVTKRGSHVTSLAVYVEE